MSKVDLNRIWIPSFVVLAVLVVGLWFAADVAAEDWPTYRHDNRRSGVTAESIDAAGVAELWVYRAAFTPTPAWHGPAKWDAYSGNLDLRSMRNYDPAYYVTVAGDSLFFAASAEDAVYCLDSETSAVKWTFTPDAPARIVPTWYKGKVYFGADDGHAYCLDANKGKLVWKTRAAGEADRLLPNNGKLISLFPVRTGVLVEDGKAFFGGALLPWNDAYLCGADAKTGSLEGAGHFQKKLRDVTLEGALLASPTKLYVPQGRSAPLVFGKDTGQRKKPLENAGGVFALLTPDMQLVHGPPSQKEKWVALSDPETGDKIASFDRGNFMIVTEDKAFVLKDDELLAVQRSDGETLWTVPSAYPYTLILVGETLLAGGNNAVAAFNTADGATVATIPVSGRAYGIAAANGQLYVSTDTGAIHCLK